MEKEIRISGKTVEEVGFEEKRLQLAVLQNLKVAVLDGLCIAGVESTRKKEISCGIGHFRHRQNQGQVPRNRQFPYLT